MFGVTPFEVLCKPTIISRSLPLRSLSQFLRRLRELCKSLSTFIIRYGYSPCTTAALRRKKQPNTQFSTFQFWLPASRSTGLLLTDFSPQPQRLCPLLSFQELGEPFPATGGTRNAATRKILNHQRPRLRRRLMQQPLALRSTPLPRQNSEGPTRTSLRLAPRRPQRFPMSIKACKRRPVLGASGEGRGCQASCPVLLRPIPSHRHPLLPMLPNGRVRSTFSCQPV